jgi:hypothetical protein
MIKDLRWLNKTDSADLPEHMRLNHLPALAGYLPAQASESIILKEIWRQNLPFQYEMSSISNTLIEAILSDEQTVSLRDLPAFLACGSSMLAKLTQLNQTVNGNRQTFNDLADKLLTLSEHSAGIETGQAAIDTIFPEVVAPS